MAIFEVNNVKIAGLSAIVPANELFNRDYDYISESERELLIKTTGIVSRRVVKGGETVLDLSFEAAEKLIAKLNWEKSEIELLI
jgi:3-oxoacyl-[acyl-carrier-protein] synthase-3